MQQLPGCIFGLLVVAVVDAAVAAAVVAVVDAAAVAAAVAAVSACCCFASVDRITRKARMAFVAQLH